MRGFELTKARSDRLAQLRRSAQNELPMTVALDREMLYALIGSGDSNARGNVLRRALIFRGLIGLGEAPAEIGRHFKESAETVERHASAQLLAEPQLARSLEAQVREEITETPEPGRYVEPTGNFA